jgi:MYXO-CTERM domain-containing protein
VRFLNLVFIMKQLLGLFLCVPAIAFGAVQTFTSTGALTTLPGYGYEISASYDAVVGYSLFTEVVDKFETGDMHETVTHKLLGLKVALTPSSNIYATDSAVDLAFAFNLSFVNLATGERGLPSYFFQPAGTGHALLLGNVSTYNYSASTIQSPPSELRFSNYQLSVSSTATDGAMPLPLGDVFRCDATGAPWSTCGGYFPKELQLTYTAHFVPGNYLAASNDPACASLDCMIHARDSLFLGPLSAELSITTVGVIPEPEPALLLLVGLAGLALLRRRSMHRLP